MSLRAKRRNLAPKRIGNLQSQLLPLWLGSAGLAAAALLCLPNAAEARRAQCFTSDRGDYKCTRVDDKQGGFTISAPGKETVVLQIAQPGDVLESEKEKAKRCIEANRGETSVIAFGITKFIEEVKEGSKFKKGSKFKEHIVRQAGFYCRDPADKACWDNDNGVTRVRVCARSRP